MVSQVRHCKGVPWMTFSLVLSLARTVLSNEGITWLPETVSQVRYCKSVPWMTVSLVLSLVRTVLSNEGITWLSAIPPAQCQAAHELCPHRVGQARAAD